MRSPLQESSSESQAESEPLNEDGYEVPALQRTVHVQLPVTGVGIRDEAGGLQTGDAGAAVDDALAMMAHAHPTVLGKENKRRSARARQQRLVGTAGARSQPQPQPQPQPQSPAPTAAAASPSKRRKALPTPPANDGGTGENDSIGNMATSAATRAVSPSASNADLALREARRPQNPPAVATAATAATLAAASDDGAAAIPAASAPEDATAGDMEDAYTLSNKLSSIFGSSLSRPTRRAKKGPRASKLKRQGTSDSDYDYTSAYSSANTADEIGNDATALEEFQAVRAPVQAAGAASMKPADATVIATPTESERETRAAAEGDAARIAAKEVAAKTAARVAAVDAARAADKEKAATEAKAKKAAKEAAAKIAAAETATRVEEAESKARAAAAKAAARVAAVAATRVAGHEKVATEAKVRKAAAAAAAKLKEEKRVEGVKLAAADAKAKTKRKAAAAEQKRAEDAKLAAADAEAKAKREAAAAEQQRAEDAKRAADAEAKAKREAAAAEQQRAEDAKRAADAEAKAKREAAAAEQQRIESEMAAAKEAAALLQAKHDAEEEARLAEERAAALSQAKVEAEQLAHAEQEAAEKAAVNQAAEDARLQAAEDAMLQVAEDATLQAGIEAAETLAAIAATADAGRGRLATATAAPQETPSSFLPPTTPPMSPSPQPAPRRTGAGSATASPRVQSPSPSPQPAPRRTGSGASSPRAPSPSSHHLPPSAATSLPATASLLPAGPPLDGADSEQRTLLAVIAYLNARAPGLIPEDLTARSRQDAAGTDDILRNLGLAAAPVPSADNERDGGGTSAYRNNHDSGISAADVSAAKDAVAVNNALLQQLDDAQNRQKAVEQRYESETRRTRAQYVAEAEAARMTYMSDLEGERVRHSADLARERVQYTADVKVVRGQHDKYMTEVRAKHAVDLSAAESKLRTADTGVSLKHAAELADMHQKQSAAHEALKSDYQRQLGHLKQEHSLSRTKEIEEQAACMAILDDKCRTLSTKLDHAVEELAGNRHNSTAAHAAELQAMREALTAKLMAAEDRANSSLATADAVRGELELELLSARKETLSLTETHNVLQTELARYAVEADARVLLAKNEAIAVQTVCREQAAESRRLNQALTSVNEQADAAKKVCREQSTESRRLNQELASVHEELERVRDSLVNKASSGNDIAAELESLKYVIELKTKELKDLRFKNADLQDQVEQARTSVKEADAVSEVHQSRTEELRASLDAKRTAHDKLIVKNASLMSDLRSLTDDLRTISSQNKELRATVENFNETGVMADPFSASKRAISSSPPIDDQPMDNYTLGVRLPSSASRVVHDDDDDRPIGTLDVRLPSTAVVSSPRSGTNSPISAAHHSKLRVDERTPPTPLSLSTGAAMPPPSPSTFG